MSTTTIPALNNKAIPVITDLLEISENPGSFNITIDSLKNIYQPINEKAAVNGYASLDGAGLVPLAQIPTAVLNDTLIFVGNGSNLAIGVALSGDANITNTGVLTIQNDVVTLAKLAPGTAGNIISYDPVGDPVAVSTGTSGQVLTSNGVGLAPTFQLNPVDGIASLNADTTPAQIIAVGTGLGLIDAGATHTLSIDATVATLTGVQTLTNKTLSTGTSLGAALNCNNQNLENIADIEYNLQGDILSGSFAYTTYAGGAMYNNVPTGSVHTWRVNNVIAAQVSDGQLTSNVQCSFPIVFANDLRLLGSGTNRTIFRTNQTGFDRFLDFPDQSGTDTVVTNNTTATLSAKTLAGVTLSGAIAGGQQDIDDIQKLEIRHTLDSFFPLLEFFQDEVTPTATDNLGRLTWYGNNSVAAKTAYGEVRTIIEDPTSTTEDGALELRANLGGAGLSSMIILNDASNGQIDMFASVDFNNNTPTGLRLADNTVTFDNPAGTNRYTFRSSAIAGPIDITYPLLTTSDVFVFEAFTQTLTNKTLDLASNTVTGTTAQFNTALSDNDFATLAGIESLTNKTFNNTNEFEDNGLIIQNPANTFNYIFQSAAITVADRTITLPLLTGNDIMTLNDFAATLTNKTLGTATAFSVDFTLNDGVDIILNATTGSAIGTATTQKLSFYGATPIVQGAALTTALTTVTFTAPGTPDYAIQDLVASTGFGFVTSDEAQTVLSVIANLQARVNELEARLDATTGVGLIA